MATKDFSSEDLPPAIKADFNLLLITLKRRQLVGSAQCIKATLEMLRSMLGRYNFSSTEHMLKTVRGIGRELTAAAQTELTIGNLVRRILFLIREEYAHCVREAEVNLQQQQRNRTTSKDLTKAVLDSKPTSVKRKDRSNSVTSNHSNPNDEELLAAVNSAFPHDSSIGILSSNNHDSEDYSRLFPELRGAVIKEINDINNEIDNYTVICSRAPDYVHAEECILTYGYSRIVEQFLKAAGVKRRFQLIIAEAAPGLDGHKLAHSLSKSSPNISITIIPDSNIYAIMARVNKVILSPHAVMADGGAISPSGQLMVATAAKEFLVPVVCVSGAFSLTPLFAHNQSLALQQLQSPSSAFPYNTDINFTNVEVIFPAFDHITPDLISLYVTNDGSYLPSYMFRL
eukprot:CAMPEP_0173151004 /NCGR_PEP_ID=MMETSP1105-20130129/11310_1 /TAXON_ID=2985 /ORGANISM="Ochromonas sp., Strain BG-1" /LENGTH=399 /DNA_ID=CAMNT_0014066273 /DNA_START=44 /DNA_END=1239 /DNA_ORIENTATION=+